MRSRMASRRCMRLHRCAPSAYSLRANQSSWPGELQQSPSHPIPASRNDVLTTTIDASRVIRVVWGSSSACAPHFLPCHSLFHTNLKSPCAEQRRRPLPARAVRLRADHLRLPSLPCDDTGALVPQEWLQILDGSRAGGVACRAERGILLDAAARGEPNGVLEASSLEKTSGT